MGLLIKKLCSIHRIYMNYCVFFIPRVCCSSFKSTLLLPKTKFPHKVKVSDRRQRDQMIESVCNFEDLYYWQRLESKGPEFILHDGPPYANGDVHIGHAVNKILKDIVVRQKLLQGYKINFVPGWDCHGLPIELKVLKNSDLKNTSDLAVRKRAYSFSQETKGRQMKSFKEWGIMADWKYSYVTCHPDYVIQQLKIFQDLYDQGIIYRDHKPVFWSPSNKTSLAEAELEYNQNHISPSVFIKFGVVHYPEFLLAKLNNKNISAIIWTTTPWTLPANQAVCYSPEKQYSVVQCKSNMEYYLVAEEMISSLANTLKTELVLIQSFEGDALKDFKYMHPVNKNRECSFFPAHHVTMTKGTGLVHTAPNHGLDDYFVAKKQNFPLDVCLVDDNGYFTTDAGQELAGKNVLNEGSKRVIDMLSRDIICVEKYVHSYPYDWRSKTPVIVKSSHQWFIDVQRFKNQAMECLRNIKVYPDSLKKVFLNQLSSSPQWCISRQRCWGVPIPAFYAEGSPTPVVNRILTDHICHTIKKHGIHSWWEVPVDDLLPRRLVEECGLKDLSYKKGSDIMDIWLDSGISWRIVLPEPHISDVCLEGIDQIRGWFNSSLITSVVLRGKAPTKAFVLHGFTTDAEGRKMSKSEGNVISPNDIIYGSKAENIPGYGIDVLRWWVGAHACQHENIALKPQILEECSQNINKLRNVFKFLLGNLYDFNFQKDAVLPSRLRPFDLYALHSLQKFLEKIQEEYDAFQYKNVAKDIVNFTSNDVSSFYCQLVKDRLYCDPKHSVERLSAQTILFFTLNALIKGIGAICPHLAEEVVMHHPDKELAKKGLFRASLPHLKDYISSIPNPSCVEPANQIRQTVLKSDLKTLGLHATIVGSSKVTEDVQSLNTNTSEDSGCIEFFQVSSLAVNSDLPETLPEKANVIKGHITCEDKTEPFTVVLSETKLHRCDRCRRYSSSVPSSLCRRCQDILNCNNSQIMSEV